MNTIKEQQVGNYKVKVVYDEDAENPREWDDLFTIYSNHRRINPDGHTIEELEDENGQVNIDGKFGLMIWLYEHSGYAFKTTELEASNPFGNGIYARFDSGQFGIIAAPIDELKRRLGDNWETEAKQLAENEIKTFNQYANGEVFAYRICDNDGDVVSSCGDWYDVEEALKEGIAEAKQIIENNKNEVEELLEDATFDELKSKFYELAQSAPIWVDDLFELIDEDKAREWLKKKLREMVE